MSKKQTVFQALDKAINGNWGRQDAAVVPHVNSYDMSSHGKDIIYRTTNKDDYEQKKLELQQDKYLKDRWVKANVNLSVTAFAGLNNIKLMYRDADLMDAFPEIGAALDIVSEEASITTGGDGMVVHVSSKSERVKSILEDLFVNRLNLQLTAQMIIRAMAKYGNQFMLLNIDRKNGVMGWKQLPVFNVERIENGIQNPYGAGASIAVNGVNSIDPSDLSTQFVWLDDNNSQVPFREWQVAHFRLLSNSLYLPYGCLVGDTRIETEDGYKEIQDIEIGDKVWTFNVDTQERELSEVTMWMPKGEKEVYEIYTKHNYLQGTPDHKILTSDGVKFEYKEIKDIKVGDLVAIRQGIQGSGHPIKIDKSVPSLMQRPNLWFSPYIDRFPEYVNEEIAEFIGYMIGDGSITYKRIINIAGGVSDIFNDKYQEIAERLSGRKCKRIYRKDGSLLSIVCQSRFLGEMLLRMGYICGFHNKRIPSWVYQAETFIKQAFIRGLINADGYMFLDRRKPKSPIRYDIEVENEQLMKDLKILCQSLGYKTGQIFKRHRKPHYSKKIGHMMNHTYPSYELSFYETPNTQEKCNDIQGRLTNDFQLEKVRKVEYVGQAETYDITVDSLNSNFFANGIITHNCSYLNAARRHWRMLSLMEDMMLIYRLERSIERRVYKIYVGAIDDADIPAYIEQVANEFKRTPIIDPMTGQVDLRKNILPVHKDTPIPLLDGRTITIKQLAKEYEDGKENYVYSVQDKTLQIVPGKVAWCGKNYTAEKLVKITLDDETYTIMAPEHEIIMRDGSKKRADEVKEGESVMPLYKTCNPNAKEHMARYEKVYNPNSGKYEYTHRLVGQELSKAKVTYNTIHHKDFNRYNNNPNNLLWCDFNEHHHMHSVNSKKMWANNEKRQQIIQHMKEYFLTEKGKEQIARSSKQIIAYNKSVKHREETSKRSKALGYVKQFQEYNNSPLHQEHNTIRQQAVKQSWKNENIRQARLEKTQINFPQDVWDKMRNLLLSNRQVSKKEVIEYLNHVCLNSIIAANPHTKRLHRDGFIGDKTLIHNLQRKNFQNFREYKKAILQNHKILKVEWVKGDDVYCMTVQGLKGEEDRHNFALCSINADGSWNKNGIFVSNCCDQDLFIPVRDPASPTPIDTLAPAQNLTAMDDIKFVQNKVLTALRIPKTFLNFEENAGDGKNLALMDIRFTRTINRIQQAFLMELTRVASIHLFLLGFDDELTNFTLSMNNPSTQAEQLEIENMQKKIDAVRDAVSDPGNGLPVMSLMRALREIMRWSDKQIKENFEEIRLEKGIAAELEKTPQIIQRTGVFDKVDRIYGEPGAEYAQDQQGQGGMGDAMGGSGGMGGGPAPSMDSGSDLDGLGAPGADDTGDINGQEGSMPTGEMPLGNEENQQQQPMENSLRKKPLINESKLLDELFDRYLKQLDEAKDDKDNAKTIRAGIYDKKSLLLSEEFDKMIGDLSKYVDEK